MRKDKGITIIILVITIIIMLILVGVVIYGIQDTGVFESAHNTVEKSNEKTKREEKMRNKIEQDWSNEVGSPVTSPTDGYQPDL